MSPLAAFFAGLVVLGCLYILGTLVYLMVELWRMHTREEREAGALVLVACMCWGGMFAIASQLLTGAP